MKEVDAVVVGAGFGGLYMIHKLRELGFSVQGFERGDDVGGTWYWNRYPGARCDVESLDYSFSFDPQLEQEWEWTERFATQPEIERYLVHVADRYDLRPSIRFGTTVERAKWSDEARRWHVETDKGEAVDARFLILATGSLSAAKAPDIEGVDSFKGEVVQTSSWHEGISYAGKNVGVIGTGSTGIQAIPMIAREAASLTVFQRTPTFTVPARNAPLSKEAIDSHKARYPELREGARQTYAGWFPVRTGKKAAELSPEELESAYEEAWRRGGPGISSTVEDMMVDTEANESLAEFFRRKIRETVKDPERASGLIPTGFPIGSKRLAVDTDYYETFNLPNVHLKDLRKTPLKRIVPEGVETSDGVTPVDMLVLATGFDAITGSFLRIDIDNGEGLTLRRKWEAGPLTYLGLMSEGFPNLFFIAGPGSPSVLSNMVVSIEQHVEWIADCLVDLKRRGVDRIEATQEAEEKWVKRCNDSAAGTLFMSGQSWYLGANVPGKPRVFMPFIGGVGNYRRICDKVKADDYAGFALN